jgi:hypothetical protein
MNYYDLIEYIPHLIIIIFIAIALGASLATYNATYEWLSGKIEKNIRSKLKDEFKNQQICFDTELKKEKNDFQEQLKKKKQELETKKDDFKKSCEAKEGKLNSKEKELEIIENDFKKLCEGKSKQFPTLIKALQDAEQIKLDKDIYYLKTRTAPKTADEIKRQCSEKTKEYLSNFKKAQYCVDFYEKLFPHIKEYLGCNLDDWLNSPESETTNDEQNEEIDPLITQNYIPQIEYNKLSNTERNKLGLKRVIEGLERANSPFQIGYKYERICGHEFEKNGYIVNYNGVAKGKLDCGIDLICKRDEEIVLIQCKARSEKKNSKIHQNTISQFLGDCLIYCQKENLKTSNIKAIIMINYESLDDEAKDAIETFKKIIHIEIQIIEMQSLFEIPMIKANMESLIYHLYCDLSFRQMNAMNGKNKCFKTIEDAENQGYRRSYKYIKKILKFQ